MSTVWTVLSPGSPGKTSLVINLGVLYAKRYPDQKVVIVDFSFQKPDIAPFLDLTSLINKHSLKTLDDLYPLLSGFQTIVLNDFLSTPFLDLPNFYVIPGFSQTKTHNQLSREQWSYFFAELGKLADLLIFDTDRDFQHPGFQYLLGETDTFLLAIEADPLLTKHVLDLFNYLSKKGRSMDIRVVQLRNVVGQAYGQEHIAQVLEHEVDFLIPNISRREYEKQVYNAKPIAFSVKHAYTVALIEMLSKMLDGFNNNVLDSRRELWNTLIQRFFKKSQNT